MSDSHNALIVPTLDSYVVSCSCGWVGASHDSPEPAEREAKDHEATRLRRNGLRQSSPDADRS